MSNTENESAIEEREDGLYERKTGRKLRSPLDRDVESRTFAPTELASAAVAYVGALNKYTDSEPSAVALDVASRQLESAARFYALSEAGGSEADASREHHDLQKNRARGGRDDGPSEEAATKTQIREEIAILHERALKARSEELGNDRHYRYFTGILDGLRMLDGRILREDNEKSRTEA